MHEKCNRPKRPAPASLQPDKNTDPFVFFVPFVNKNHASGAFPHFSNALALRHHDDLDLALLAQDVDADIVRVTLEQQIDRGAADR